MKDLKIFADGYRLVMEWPRPGGGAPKSRIYLDRRCGLAWPTARGPGYFCVCGLLDEPTPSGPRPVVLLAEQQEADHQRLFTTMTATMRKLHCGWILADGQKDWDSLRYELHRHVVKKNIRGLKLLEAHDFSGIAEARPVIERLVESKSLRISRATILFKQLAHIGAGDLRERDQVKPEERFFAVHAFSHVVTSWEMYPWKRPTKFEDRYQGRRPGYGA